MATTEQKRDYYEVLGADRSATRDQIKQAYRKLALQYHPDRNKAPDATAKFREIAEAYAVLSDDAKRREYDTGGHAGVSERWSTEDLVRDFQFGDFFGGRFDDLSSIFGDFLGRRMWPGQAQGVARGTDLRYDLDLTLDEAAQGDERLLQVTRSEKCQTCKGSGAKPGTKPTPCGDCKGTGQKQQVRSSKGMKLVTVLTCDHCRGRGLFIESPCLTCQANGYTFAPHSLKVQIPPGVDDGMVIRLAGQGESNANGGQPGDLLIRTHLRPHPLFQRQGDDLYTAVPISFAEAALGTKVSIPCLGGETVHVTVPAGTQSGTALRLHGKGMPRLGGKGKGNLLVIVEVRTPTDLTTRQRELLQEFAKLETRKK
ncbi:MAG: molecular chaperone DnaJ [Nitrospirae bacterium]|nr:molecular chaperone DnaJ [Nitrospirota bacterium]